MQVLRIPDIVTTTGSANTELTESGPAGASWEGSSGPAAALGIPSPSHQWALY